MFVIVWKYVVRPDATDEFRAGYGPQGDWAQLFGRSPAYMGTELISAHSSDAHVTIDRWTSEAAADAFFEDIRVEYEQLDERMDALTESEDLVLRGTVDGSDDHPST